MKVKPRVCINDYRISVFTRDPPQSANLKATLYVSCSLEKFALSHTMLHGMDDLY
jgi:hypothetical protein